MTSLVSGWLNVYVFWGWNTVSVIRKTLFDWNASVTPFLSVISVKYKRKQNNLGSRLIFFPPESGGIWAHQLSGLEATGGFSNTWMSFQFSKKLCVGWKESRLPPTDRWASEILPLFLDIFKYLENNIKINDWQNDDYSFQYFHGCTIRTAHEERAESYIIIVGAAKVSTLI